MDFFRTGNDMGPYSQSDIDMLHERGWVPKSQGWWKHPDPLKGWKLFTVAVDYERGLDAERRTAPSIS